MLLFSTMFHSSKDCNEKIKGGIGSYILHRVIIYHKPSSTQRTSSQPIDLIEYPEDDATFDTEELLLFGSNLTGFDQSNNSFGSE